MTIDLKRRALLIASGAALGGVVTRLPRQVNDVSITTDDYEKDLAALLASMNDAQRQYSIKAWDHPARQITNTIAVNSGPHIGTLFNHDQQHLISRLYQGMLSQRGVQLFKNTVSLEGKLSAATFTLYSDLTSNSQRKQLNLNGGHFMLRRGAEQHSGYAFGGPIAYGQQIGNGRFKVQGNAFKTHGDSMHELHASLSDAERRQAYQTVIPSELDLQPLGSAEQHLIPGLRLGSVSESAQEAAKALLENLFSAYPAEQSASAFSAIEQYGGVTQLRLSLYTDYGFYAAGRPYTSSEPKEESRLPYIQRWRLEGPNSVIHFSGYPHVHAYIAILSDPNKRNVGAEFADLARSYQGPQLQELWQAAMRSTSRLSLAYYLHQPHGRLPKGPVSMGSIYGIEPFDNSLVIVRARWGQLSSMAKQSLQTQLVEPPQADAYVEFATMDYLSKQKKELGVVEKVLETGPKMRSVMAKYLRTVSA